MNMPVGTYKCAQLTSSIGTAGRRSAVRPCAWPRTDHPVYAWPWPVGRPLTQAYRTNAVQSAPYLRILVARRDDVLGACDSVPKRRPPDRRRGWPHVDHPVPGCLRGRCAIDPTGVRRPQLAEDTVLADETTASMIERLPDAPAPPPDLRSADSWAFPAPQFQQVREMLRVDGWCLTRGRAPTLVAG